ncbi:MAG: DUF6209 family protein [Cyanobacteria bacterium J06592_8]
MVASLVSSGVAEITFTSGDWQENLQGELIPGGTLKISYDSQRLTVARDYHYGQPAWNITAYIQFQANGAVQNKPLQPVGQEGILTAEFHIPYDAQEVVMWFYNWGYYTGYNKPECYDSNENRNYRFPVTKEEAEVIPSPTNTETSIAFSDKYIKTTHLTNAENYYIKNRTIVVNLGNEKAYVAENPEKYLSPRTSTILQDITIKSGDSLLLLEITNFINIGGIILEDGWDLYGNIDSGFSKKDPLWKSTQFEIGTVEFDPYFVTGLSDQPQQQNLKRYKVKVNLWFAPAASNCGIHIKHMDPDFLEVHTQIYGVGRMQKFHTNSFDTFYEDVILAPGDTHIPFASVAEDGGFIYPWHQYYSDNDCIWMANEFHPVES